MNQHAEHAGALLGHASVDALVYGCLIAALSEGPGAHRVIEARLQESVSANGRSTPVISSAGALINTLKRGGYRRVGVLAPYHPELDRKACVLFCT